MAISGGVETSKQGLSVAETLGSCLFSSVEELDRSNPHSQIVKNVPLLRPKPLLLKPSFSDFSGEI